MYPQKPFTKPNLPAFLLLTALTFTLFACDGGPKSPGSNSNQADEPGYTNGDLMAPNTEIDLDGDGNIDGVTIDSDDDGFADGLDIDNDGIIDYAYIDSDDDGMIDGFDSNNDGIIDIDLNGNQVDNPASQDTAAPTLSNNTITVSEVSYTSLVLEWTEAEDDKSTQADLEYKVVASTSDNISTIDDAEKTTGGRTVIQDWTADIGNKSVFNITDATTYYFNVLVRDEAANKAIFTTVSATTLADVTPATVGNSGTLTFNETNYYNFIVDWIEASDPEYNSSELEYKVVISELDNMTTINDAELTTDTRQVAMDWTKDVTVKNVTGKFDGSTELSSNQLYYVQVLVRDGAGNKSIYVTNSTTTATPIVINYCNLQFPSTINGTANTPLNETIYTRFYIAGVTDSTPNVNEASYPTDLVIQIGLGPSGTDPNISTTGWNFATAVSNAAYSDVGNNDEFQLEVNQGLPAGNYRFLARYSGDGGTNWVYCATNGTDISGTPSYDFSQAGVMTISP